MTEPLTDEELAQKAQAGSRRCFEELVDRYSPKLFNFLRPKIASNQDIEDIIQETFFKLYRNIFRYDSKWKFSTWIYTAAHRMAISFYRSKDKRISKELPAFTAADPEDKVIQEVLSQNIWKKAQSLNPDHYEALWLRYVEDMSSKEIAKVMKRSQVAVRLLLHRARLNLAKQFQTDPEFEREVSNSVLEGKKIHFEENRG